MKVPVEEKLDGDKITAGSIWCPRRRRFTISSELQVYVKNSTTSISVAHLEIALQIPQSVDAQGFQQLSVSVL